MSFSTRLDTSWQLLIRSLSVLRQNPRLLVFPLFTFACAPVIIVFFLVSANLQTYLHPGAWQEQLNKLSGDATYHYFYHLAAFYLPSFILLYLFAMFAGTFLNVALFNEIMRALRGEPVSITRGLRFARSRIYSILAWSLFAGLVGWVINYFTRRLGLAGRLAGGLVGMTWSVACVFVIPVMVRDSSINPLVLLRNSAATLKKTWGESLAGYLGITLANGLMLSASMIFIVVGGRLGFALGENRVLWIMLGTFLSWLLTLVAYTFLMSIAGSIYRCALYMYATEGVVPAPYTTAQMDAAWKMK